MVFTVSIKQSSLIKVFSGDRHLRRGDVVVSSGKQSFVFCEKLEVDRLTSKVRGFSSRDWRPVDNTIQKLVHEIQQLVNQSINSVYLV